MCRCAEPRAATVSQPEPCGRGGFAGGDDAVQGGSLGLLEEGVATAISAHPAQIAYAHGEQWLASHRVRIEAIQRGIRLIVPAS
jgi:hypothetical protein